MKKNLLFVTYHDDHCEEGLSYAIDLAKIMRREIAILLVFRKNLMERFEDVMTAVAFAEAGESETARSLYAGAITGKDTDSRINLLTTACRKSGIQASVQTATQDIVSSVKDFLRKKTAVDIVLLSPSVVHNDAVTAKELQKLVKTASRPIVTMTRQATAPA